jgi:hypothetical protein
MNMIDTRVRDLQVGDYLPGSRQTVLAVGRVMRDWGYTDRATYYCLVRVRRDNGNERVASWRPDTRMRVERTGA